ncbi:MAG: HK97 family phage prohead protease, partial [Gemmatimonadota bacterium]
MPDECLCTRGLLEGVEIRAVNEEERSAEFVAATENGVSTGYGPREHLRVRGADLKRYARNSVILDSHNRDQVDAVIGRGEARKAGRELVVKAIFASTPRAETAWQLVKGGFIRAVSVGFIPDRASIRELAEGETDGEGEGLITGPARVIRKWELYEISLVPVPADADALRRAFGGDTIVLTPAALAALLAERAPLAAPGIGKESDMPDSKKPDAPGVTAPAAGGATEQAAK